MTIRTLLLVLVCCAGLLFVGLGRVLYAPWGSLVALAIAVAGAGMLYVGDAVRGRK